MSSSAAAAPASDVITPPAHHHEGLPALALGALGVVFGDIGTSPIYAFRDALALAGQDGLVREEVFGVLSLALWALILIVTIKYVLFLMRADNEGEGGVLALMALAQAASKRRTLAILALGAMGASLFYGDGIITPALSVLSAVEGLQTVPSLAPRVTEPVVLMVGLAILVALFAVQSTGTAGVAKLFGPVCLLWFAVLALLGIAHIRDEPAILLALWPGHAVGFMLSHGVAGLFVLGAVFLTVTGAEALTADMAHFGRAPIQAGWFALVFPALILNYLGQGAFSLHALERAEAMHQAWQSQNWFFLMAPGALRVPLVILSLLATVIASQAVITGAFSLTAQAIQLGLLPRMTIRQTSAKQAGQIYVPLVNTLLFLGVVGLVLGFRSSSAMAAAYGISVTGTMVVTTCLAFVVIYRLWKWRLPLAIAFIAPFLAIDLSFFGANILRVIEGGWVPLVVASIVALLIFTWVKGWRNLRRHLAADTIPQADMVASLERSLPPIVPGTAVFLTASAELAPLSLLHNLKHNKVLHERNLFVTLSTDTRPYLSDAERVRWERLSPHFERVRLRFGFMERPNLPRDLATFYEGRGEPLSPMGTSFFISRLSIKPSHDGRMPLWQDLLFLFMQRNAADPTAIYGIPPNRMLELGAQMMV